MEWEIINTDPIVPRCNLCHNTTSKMARFHPTTTYGSIFYICSSCAKSVKDCMDKWAGPDIDYVDKDDIAGIFDDIGTASKQVDRVLFPEVNPVCRCGQSGLHTLTDACRQK